MVELTAKTLPSPPKEGIKAYHVRRQQRKIQQQLQQAAYSTVRTSIWLGEDGTTPPPLLQRCTPAACDCCDVHELTRGSTRPRNKQTRLRVSRDHRPDYASLLIAKDEGCPRNNIIENEHRDNVSTYHRVSYLCGNRCQRSGLFICQLVVAERGYSSRAP